MLQRERGRGSVDYRRDGRNVAVARATADFRSSPAKRCCTFGTKRTAVDRQVGLRWPIPVTAATTLRVREAIPVTVRAVQRIRSRCTVV